MSRSAFLFAHFRPNLPPTGPCATGYGERILQKRRAVAEMEPSGSNPLPSRQLQILLVEDNPKLAQSFVFLVASRQHIVEIAHAPEVALRKAQRAVPDLIFLDLGMRGVNGHEFVQKFRSVP